MVRIDGLSKIYTASSDAYAFTLAEGRLPTLSNQANKPAVTPLLTDLLPSKSITHLFAAHTAVGKNVFPRVAGALDVSMISDIIDLEASGDEFTRPIYAGNAILKVKSKDSIKVVTVRTTAFDKASVGTGGASVEEIKAVETDCKSRCESDASKLTLPKHQQSTSTKNSQSHQDPTLPPQVV